MALDTLEPSILGVLEIVEVDTSARRVVVMASTGYMNRFEGKVPVSELVYRWPGGPLAVGDMVLCPPTPWLSAPFEAMVVSLDASGHPYQGPVKSIMRKISGGEG
jgi:hypothetical protein